MRQAVTAQHGHITLLHCSARPTESTPVPEAPHHAVSCNVGMQVGIQGVRMAAIQVAMGVHNFHLQIKRLIIGDTPRTGLTLTWIEKSLMRLP